MEFAVLPRKRRWFGLLPPLAPNPVLPATVPVLTASDITKRAIARDPARPQRILSLGDAVRRYNNKLPVQCCLSGWAFVVSIDVSQLNQGSQWRYVYQTDMVRWDCYHLVLEAMESVVRSSVIGFNDRLDVTADQAADVWNRAVRSLGYV